MKVLCTRQGSATLFRDGVFLRCGARGSGNLNRVVHLGSERGEAGLEFDMIGIICDLS